MSVILLFAFLLSSFVGAVPSASGAQSWYVERNKEHRQPPPAYSYIEDYGACYLDREHGDDAEERVLYLTFDAGYENGNVEKILNVLKEKGVPGAFFILDNLILRNPELVIRMRDEGHLVCNHTAKHRDMSKITDRETFGGELYALEALYRERIGGEMAKFYRPPEGKFSEMNLKMASELGYTTVFWSLAYADWDNKRQPDEQEAIQKLLANTHNGAIVLLHPTSATNAAILGRLIDAWREQGYRFGTLDEIRVRHGV